MTDLDSIRWSSGHSGQGPEIGGTPGTIGDHFKWSQVVTNSGYDHL